MSVIKKTSKIGKIKNMAYIRTYADGRVVAKTPDFPSEEQIPEYAAFIIAAVNLYAHADTRHLVIKMFIAKQQQLEQEKSPIIMPSVPNELLSIEGARRAPGNGILISR